ncbi:MAG TPA: hypothetical protein VK447_12215, partial [Myxococcaceae bacterium]|nr:hypothetical protein [Myxococcaceae bacterium]
FQQTSSCMTCHARATIGLRAPDASGTLPQLPNTLTDLVQFSPVLAGPVGEPDPKWYLGNDGRPIYTRTSFLWSMPYRAQSTSGR